MNWYKIAETLKDVRLVGKLLQTKNGFTYLDIPDSVVNALFALIDSDKIQKPPYDLKKYNSIGAHISVFEDKEISKNALEIKEIGREYNFSLGELKSTKPKGWDEVDRVYFLNVYSPELEKLRQKYGLSKLIKDHEFHITIAIEK